MERVRQTEPEIIRGRGAPRENREGECHREVVLCHFLRTESYGGIDEVREDCR